MIDNSPVTLSESMQMYIITIARLWGDRQPVPLSRLAQAFSISPVSVNEMCRKLQENGLVNYQPYKGAMLTPEGEEKANYIIRRHHLWEEFLTQRLGFEYEAAHDMACQLEHTTPDHLADRLAAFLEDPAIPSPQGHDYSDEHLFHAVLEVRLNQLTVGQTVKIIRYEFDENTQVFLEKAGFRFGVRLNILATSEDGMLVQFEDARTVSLSRSLAYAIIVNIDPTHQTPIHQIQSGSSEPQTHQEVIEMESTIDQDLRQKPVLRLTLNKLGVGQRGIVVRVGGQAQVKQRMMDMGLVPGSEVEVVRVAPLGNPVEFTVKGYHLSLRKSESAEIEVEVIE